MEEQQTAVGGVICKPPKAERKLEPSHTPHDRVLRTSFADALQTVGVGDTPHALVTATAERKRWRPDSTALHSESASKTASLHRRLTQHPLQAQRKQVLQRLH